MKRKAPNDSFVIYARGRRPTDTLDRVHVVIFDEAHKALTWLRTFAGNEPLIPAQDVIEIGPFKLKCSRYNDVFDVAEQDWQLPDQYRRWILQFKYGTWDEAPRERATSDGTTVEKRAPKPERTKRAERPDGYRTISELCAAWDIAPMIARAALRASGRPKPEYGWAFAPNEVDAIKKLCGVS